ncbi:CST complex subunit CTC1-like isoform X3 [Orbicella faveolata]|nr:CST complex subunit CTC1-like isoform X3 [Orbicella faveolata]
MASSLWLPFDHQVMPLSTLFTTSKDVFGGSLTSSQEEQIQVLGYSPTCKMPFILLGYLTLHPKSVKPITATGTLYIEDNSAAVVCEIINPDRHCLEKLVLVPEWSYVPVSSSTAKPTKNDSKDGHNGYIEIKTWVPILVTKRSTDDKKLLSWDILTIKELQQDRSSTVNLNIRGNIFALSPVHSMPSVGKPFFLVKLSCPVTNLTTSIVVQGEQFMFWHNFLQIGEQYIFYDLKEATMNKGTRNERKVLATSPRSDLCEYKSGMPTSKASKTVKRPCEDAPEVESKRPRTAQGRDDLNHRKINYNMNLTSDSMVVEKEILQAPKLRPLVNISYTGVITNCLKPEAGVFELDNKIR